MYSTQRIINNLAAFAANYTEDLLQPFGENVEQNEMAETPILVIADVCKHIGLNPKQTARVLGETGAAFVAYLNQPVDVNAFLAHCADPAASRSRSSAPIVGEVSEDDILTLRPWGLRIPIVGMVNEDGTITMDTFAKLFENHGCELRK